jgi:hypothetical protein
LAKSIISKQFYSELSQNSEYLSAVRQIENLICTHRESLLGSSAWKADFLKVLQTRPFYMVRKGAASCYFYDCGAGASGWDEERCQACGRSSQKPEYQIHLFGPSYQACKIWESNWIDFVPSLILLWKSSTKSAQKKGSVNSDKEKEKSSYEGEQKKLNWWEKKFTKELNAEPETSWQLSL